MKMGKMEKGKEDKRRNRKGIENEIEKNECRLFGSGK